MTDILFIGPFSKNNCMGETANDYAECIANFANIKTINFVPDGNSIDFNSTSAFKYSKNTLNKYDVLIQMVDPIYLYKDYRFKKNVCVIPNERLWNKTELYQGYRNTALMDKVYYFGHSIVSYLPANFAKKRFYPIIDRSVARLSNKNLEKQIKRNGQTYVFYYFYDGTEYSNIEEILQAYLTAFSIRDNVTMIIQTEEPAQKIENEIVNPLKRRINTYDKNMWAEIGVISQKYNLADQISLHMAGDCYINLDKLPKNDKHHHYANICGSQYIEHFHKDSLFGNLSNHNPTDDTAHNIFFGIRPSDYVRIMKMLYKDRRSQRISSDYHIATKEKIQEELIKCLEL